MFSVSKTKQIEQTCTCHLILLRPRGNIASKLAFFVLWLGVSSLLSGSRKFRPPCVTVKPKRQKSFIHTPSKKKHDQTIKHCAVCKHKTLCVYTVLYRFSRCTMLVRRPSSSARDWDGFGRWAYPSQPNHCRKDGVVCVCFFCCRHNKMEKRGRVLPWL